MRPTSGYTSWAAKQLTLLFGDIFYHELAIEKF